MVETASASSRALHADLRRGVSRDIEELITAIGDYIDRHDQNPKPFIWISKVSDILEKMKRARKSLNNVQSV